MSEDQRVLFDNGKDAFCESYINPFRDCENPQKLHHIIDLVVKGKLYPYIHHESPFRIDKHHPGTRTFEKFSEKLQYERAKPDGTSDWLKIYPQLADTDKSFREIYSKLRSEACEMGIALQEHALETGNVVIGLFAAIPAKGKTLLYKDARQCYIDIRSRKPELPHLPPKKNDIIEGLQEIQDLCIPAGTGQGIEPQEKDGQSKTNIPDYKALNPAKVPISRLIEQGESYTLEFKETLDYDTKIEGKNKDILLSSLKTIAGFLNAAGGTLLIGVDDSGKIKGIGRDLSIMKDSNNDKFELKIRNCLKDRFQPQPIGKVTISFENFQAGTICRVDVQASKDIIHLDNEVYVREGNTTQLLKGRRLTDWIQQRRLLTALPSGK